MDFQPSHPVPSAARGSARRHRVEGGRHFVVRVRFTDAELAAVEARAVESRVTMQRYLAGCALSRRSHLTATAAPSAVTAELTALRRLTANLTNNINQIARRLNSGGTPDASIDAALAAVRRATSPDQPQRSPSASSRSGTGPRQPRRSTSRQRSSVIPNSSRSMPKPAGATRPACTAAGYLNTWPAAAWTPRCSRRRRGRSGTRPRPGRRSPITCAGSGTATLRSCLPG
jgi:hypothetical protein